MDSDRKVTLQRFIPVTHTDHRIGHDECLGEHITSIGQWVKVQTFDPNDTRKMRLATLLVSHGNYRIV